MSTTSYRHRGKQTKCCIVQHLFSEKFDRDQTSYNKIQHDKTRYNKVAKRVQHFIKHQSCMMFGRGFTLEAGFIKFYQLFQRLLVSGGGGTPPPPFIL